MCMPDRYVHTHLCVEDGHDLFVLAVVPDDSVYCLRYIIQHQVQIQFIFLWGEMTR